MRNFSKRDIFLLIANVIEHFDSALYSFLAPIMAPLFFPNHDPIVQIILAYSLLATSAFCRPLGAIIFGKCARKYGPEFGLNLSLIGVSIGSIIMAIIPEYKEIGGMAPFLLIVVRVIKGIFGAGEGAIAKLYIIENKDLRLAYKASYLYQGSSMVGSILASAIAAFIVWSGEVYLWRMFFALSGLIGCIVWCLRINILGSKYIARTRDLPMTKVPLKKYIMPMLAISFSTGFSHMTYALPCIVMNSLVPLVCDITFAEMMQLNTFLIVLDMVLIFFCGPALQKVSYKKNMLYSLALMILTIPFLFYLLPQSSLVYVTFVRSWIILLGVIFMCPQNLFYSDISAKLIPNYNKYLAVGIANAIGAGVIGKTIPAISMWIWYETNNLLYIMCYIILLTIITFSLIYQIFAVSRQKSTP
ncbi:MAG: hypothetical protein RLZZ59_663 [Pseudomonadota bacterium]|jgi:MFS family permease